MRRGSARLQNGQRLAIAVVAMILVCGCMPQLIRAAVELALK